MKLKVKRLSEKAVIPTKAHPTDAGYDLYCSRVEVTNGCYVCHTDVAFEIPEGYYGLVFARSSISNKPLSLANAVGIIDSPYRGEVTLKFKSPIEIIANYGKRFFREYFEAEIKPDDLYKVGDRCGQIIIMPYPEIEFEEADTLSETDRGNGGYGSTGK